MSPETKAGLRRVRLHNLLHVHESAEQYPGEKGPDRTTDVLKREELRAVGIDFGESEGEKRGEFRGDPNKLVQFLLQFVLPKRWDSGPNLPSEVPVLFERPVHQKTPEV